jgi:hypothetical protein
MPALERDLGMRWTMGDATVPAALTAGLWANGGLTVHLGGGTTYYDFGARVRAV